jgi:hypothetical protein
MKTVVVRQLIFLEPLEEEFVELLDEAGYQDGDLFLPKISIRIVVWIVFQGFE